MKKISLALAVALGLTSPAAAQDRVKIMFDWIPSGWYGAWYYGKEQGCFAKQNLEIKFDRGSGGVDTVAKVAAGVSEFGLADLGTVILAAAKNKAHVAALMPVAMESPFGIMTLTENRISNLKDLEGKSLAAGPGDSNIQMLPYAMSLTSADFAKVKIQQADFSALLGMLLQKRIDAFTTFDGTADILKPIAANAGTQVSFYQYGKNLGIYGTALFGNSDFITKNPDIAKRVALGTQCALEASRANPEGVADALLNEFPDKKREVELAGIRSGIHSTFETGPHADFGFSWNPERAENSLKFTLAAQGLPGSHIRIDDVIVGLKR